MAWNLYGLVTCQVGDLESLVEIPDGNNTKMTVKQFIEDNYDFKKDFIPVVSIMHIVWMAVFLFVFAYAIKAINFQRR